MSTGDDARRRRQLREFLVARRAAVSPESVGLSQTSRRRTPGLRREELATIAGVGVTWYTWLEQGRDIRVSAETLDRIAAALRLTPTDTAYLFSLAGVPRSDSPNAGRPAALTPDVQLLLDAFLAPAFVVNANWDVEAFNVIAARVYRFDDQAGRFARNHVWRFFLDPARRALYLDWEQLVETAVGMVRMAYARRVGDPYFEDLIRALTEESSEFRTLWNAQRTAPLAPNQVRLLVPDVGEIHVTSMQLPLPTWDDHVLFLLPPVDQKSAGAIARLAAAGTSVRKRRSRPIATARRVSASRPKRSPRP
jgi:transcriptional regulator with XRE-family HTH domain